jgi:protein SCO1/2
MGSNNRFILPLVVFLIAMGIAFGFTGYIQNKGPEKIEEAHPMPEILELEFTKANNEIVLLKNISKGFKLIYFGQLTASDTDWETIRKMDRIGKIQFKKDFQPIFITLDPTRDKPKYIQSMFVNSITSVIGLNGSIENISILAKAYGIRHEKFLLPDSKLNYTIDHSDWFYLTTPDYRILGAYPSQINLERLKMEITAHMRHKY